MTITERAARARETALRKLERARRQAPHAPVPYLPGHALDQAVRENA